MKVLLCGLVAFAALVLGGCACNPGYYAPCYAPTISGCVPAIVPAP